MSRSWTDEQNALLERRADGQPTLKRVAVSADAGAGKTSVLVERIRRLPPGQRVLCVSFTEKSKADLEDRLSDLLSVEVYTIHGFCMRVVTEFGGQLGLPPITRVLGGADEVDDLFYRAFEKTYRREPPASVEHGADVFHGLCEQAREIGEGVEVIECSGDKGLRRFVGEVLAEFDRTKKASQGLEYADLERLAAKLVTSPAVAQALKQRYDHVFVDEFQDTSEIQCALVNAICRPESPLFVVGDVKQSIYRFRGADVKVFERFTQSLPERRRLSANFRSHDEIIEAVNATCGPLIEGYEPMTAARVVVNPSAAWSHVPRVARVTADSDAEGVEAVIRKLRAEGVVLSEVVILARRMRGNEKLFAELARRGIVVAATSSASSASDETLACLLNLWIWACEPWQKIRAARVVVDFPWAFAREAGSEDRLRSRLGELLSTLQDREPKSESNELTSAIESCETLLRRLDGRFALKDRFGSVYEQFQTFVLRHQSEGLAPAQLARRFERLLAAEKGVPGFVICPPPPNLAGTVRALTVHGSKGLEFPVVILVDVGPKRARSQSFFRRGAKIWLPGRDDEGLLDWSPADVVQAKEDEARDELAESARLLYVAMTRAQEALYVIDRPAPAIESEAKARAAKKADTSWSAWLKAGVSRSIPSEEFAKGAVVSASSATRVALDSSSRLLEGRSPEYVRARVGVSEIAKKVAAGAGSGKPSAGESMPPSNRGGARARLSVDEAKQLGTYIHSRLELCDWVSLRSKAAAVGMNLEKFWLWLGSTEGQLVFGQPRDGIRAWNEFAFEWNAVGAPSIVTGRIDRLIAFDSETWIIDYKVILGSKATEDLLAAYGPQLRVYAGAVKALTKSAKVRAFVVDVAASTGKVWHEVDCAESVLC